MIKLDYTEFPNSIVTSDGYLAWRVSDLPVVMQSVIAKQWIVLGGDILTVQGNDTHDSWFYDPIPSISLSENIHKSIVVTMDYVIKYINTNGTDFLFSLVLSDAFISGK